MAETYGTTTIPSDSVTVRSGGTVAISAAFESTLGLVGGYDAANGSATAGSVVTVESSADAIDLFGENSELTEQCDLAFQNGVSTIYAVPVSETSVSGESIADGETLSNVPAFDPNVQPEHDITDDNGNTINVSYDVSAETVSGTEGYINPVNGSFKGDGGTSYALSYSYGDYSAAIAEVMKRTPRFVAVLTENTTLANDLLTELNSYDQNFQFSHGIVGGMPGSSASGYSDTFDDRRLSVVLPSRAWADEAETDMARTMGAVGGFQAGQALGDSTTYESLGGFASLNTDYTNSELGTLIDNQVYPLKQDGRVFVVKDMTTSTDVRFERVYVSEVVDEATEISHEISQDFIGDANTEDNRLLLRESHTSSYEELQEDDLLENYYVQVSKGANDFEVDLTIGLDVIGVMDTIDVEITVGDVVRNGGAA